jgi:hypothetical protein
VYHDGQFDDARLNVTLACTAAAAGAAVVNHAKATQLLKVLLQMHGSQGCASWSWAPFSQRHPGHAVLTCAPFTMTLQHCFA